MKIRPCILSVLILTILMICFITVNGQTGTSNNRSLPSGLATLLGAEGLKHASVGFFAVDLTTGKQLDSYNQEMSLTPASVQKLLTTAAALEIFGPDHTFVTKLEYEGEIDLTGMLKGNLYFCGDGDPAFGSSRFASHYGDVISKMSMAVINAGIRRVEGDITGDGSLFGVPEIPDKWIWEDLANYFGATAFGLNIYDNSYNVHLKTGPETGSLAEVIKTLPMLPGITFNCQVTASDDPNDNAWIYMPYLSEKWTIKGTIPKNSDDFVIKGSIPDPAYIAAYQLKSALAEKRVEVTGQAVSDFTKSSDQNRKALFEFSSPPLSLIINLVNQKSINLWAETLLKHLALKTSGKSSTTDGCQALNEFWKNQGMDTDGLFVADGSGLSRHNALTARQLVYLLYYMKTKNPNYETFYNSLPVSGVSGTLVNFGKGTALENNLRAKSGNMEHCMSYAGYLKNSQGNEIAFAVIVNNYTCSKWEMRQILEQFLVKLYQDKNE